MLFHQTKPIICNKHTCYSWKHHIPLKKEIISQQHYDWCHQLCHGRMLQAHAWNQESIICICTVASFIIIHMIDLHFVLANGCLIDIGATWATSPLSILAFLSYNACILDILKNLPPHKMLATVLSIRRLPRVQYLQGNVGTGGQGDESCLKCNGEDRIIG